MAYEQKDNSGSVWKNEEKGTVEGSDKWADYKGSGMVNGEEVWIDLWKSETKDGKFYMSMKFRPKTQQKGQRPPQRRTLNRDNIP